jgi:hypothetical protein
MKKLVVFLGTMIMAVALALPVYAMGGGMGGGMMGGMMSNSGSGLWNGFQVPVSRWKWVEFLRTVWDERQQRHEFRRRNGPL